MLKYRRHDPKEIKTQRSQLRRSSRNSIHDDVKFMSRRIETKRISQEEIVSLFLPYILDTYIVASPGVDQ